MTEAIGGNLRVVGSGPDERGNYSALVTMLSTQGREAFRQRLPDIKIDANTYAVALTGPLEVIKTVGELLDMANGVR